MFAPDTVEGLMAAAALVNSSCAGPDTMSEVPDLVSFLEAFKYTGRRDGTVEELAQVRRLRPVLRQAWPAAPMGGGDVPEQITAVATLVNGLMRTGRAQPWLTDHDGLPWHLHVTAPEAPLVERISAESAMAFADLIRVGELDRLRICGAPDCEAVLVDMTRNKSRRFCDTGNCGNRQHVAAYRARKAQTSG